MKLQVITQDRRSNLLLDVERIDIIHEVIDDVYMVAVNSDDSGGIVLGKYKSEERAQEILRKLSNKLAAINYVNSLEHNKFLNLMSSFNTENLALNLLPYIMPLE